MLFGKRKQIVKRILVVEDEPLTAFDNELLIGGAGYDVVGPHDNVTDALGAMEGVDLILSDVKLNGERDGIELAREAGALGVPTLLVTGNCPDGAREVALGCLMKPYTDRVLRDAIKAVEELLSGGKPKIPKGLELFPITLE